MLLGEKSGLDEDVKMRYQMAGMIHILAISGLHISVLGMGLFSLLKKLAGKCTGGAYFTLRDPAVWNADRQQCICHEGSEYVCACRRSKDSGEKL